MSYAAARHRAPHHQHIRRVTHIGHTYGGSWCDLDLEPTAAGYLDDGIEVTARTPVTCLWCLAGRRAVSA